MRTILLILLTTFAVHGQDSTLVREFCNQIGQFSDTQDIELQISGLTEMVKRYEERNQMTVDSSLQDRLRFQYRLARELKKSCPNYPMDRVKLMPNAVFDLEDKLTKQQVDSLSVLTSQIKWDKKAHVYVVTIDDFYPDSTIVDFSNRYREFWAPRTKPENGVVVVVFSVEQRKLRISTGDISMTHLTDKECDEAIKVMIPHFKDGKYFEGLVNGLSVIKSRL